MNAVALLSLKTVAEHRSRYVLGAVAVAAAVAFMVAARMVTNALDAQLRSAGADESGSYDSLFLLLSLFGLIVIVASGFVIANSFQTMVSARTRELALLRTVGMRSRQVFLAVVVEGLIVGLVGALIGVVMGTIAAWAIIAPTMAGAELAAPSLSALILALFVGLSVTLAAVVAPARRATRVAPVAALSSAETIMGERLSKVRVAAGLGVLLVGLVMSLAPTGGGDLAMFSFVIGALVSFAGLSLLAPAYVPLLARIMAFGAARGPIGRMATANLARGRRRTANTTMAVVLGVTLFTGVNVVLGSVIAQARAEGYAQDDIGGVYLLAFGLTGLTIVVGLIGVVNTVVLSVRERVRELALLRAVGMTTGEVRRQVTLEGALVGFVGVGVGAVLGITGAAVLLARLGGEISVAPPWTILGVAVFGTLAIVAASTHVVARPAASCPPTLATT